MHNIRRSVMTPESIDVCVLYNPSSGVIAHIHKVATFAGARISSKEDIEARCFKVAEQLGHATRDLRALHVPRGEFKSSISYKVDVEAHKLVEQPRFAQRRRIATKQE